MPRFTRSHYVAIADALQATRTADTADLFTADAIDRVATRMADTFRRDNPAFRLDLFLRACGVVTEPASTVTKRRRS